MPYNLLRPGEGTNDDPVRREQCAMAIMAKAPRAGRVKTRLSPPLTLEESAALNICFLKDTAENLASIKGAVGLISYTPIGDEAAFDGLLPAGFALIGQRGDAFGERLLASAEDILACGYGAVCLIDSDSPTVPAAALQAAIDALAQPGDRIVLGPSDDGGYYLVGLKKAHAAIFERITWSTASVLAETMQRAKEAGIEVVLLPLWYDVDDAATLSMLSDELLEAKIPAFAEAAGYTAPHTREFLLRRRVAVSA